MTPASANQWTADQLTAITTADTSLLVSAAAGSGKTSVLAERCVALLCDGDNPCEVHELLVVTFTESAAAEMKARIGKSLRDRNSTSPTPRTARHLALLDRASIGTLHAFCSRLLRQNFNLLGIDPDFRILDADEASLLKIDVARELFSDRFDDEQDSAFRDMVTCYADGDDDRLIRQVIRTYDTLCSVVNPPAWLKAARNRIEQAIDLPLTKSELGIAYLTMIRGELQSILNRCVLAGNAVKALKHFPDYVEDLRARYFSLKYWLKVLDSHGIDALRDETLLVEFPPLPRMSSDTPNKDVAKAHVDSVRGDMKSGNWRKCLMFSEEEWKEGLHRTLPHVDIFLSLVQDFADRYSHKKDETGDLDFADLEQLALKCLKGDDGPTRVARAFHQQYRHVLVDEYQDINQVQDAILSLVSRECLGRVPNLPPNLFCVGDVKQSIYRFRLAETQQFLTRAATYRQPQALGKVVDLQANFRSRARLLESINSVFERLMTRDAAELDYDQSHRLVAGSNFAEFTAGFTGAPVELHLVSREAYTPSPDSETDEIDLDQVEREATLVGKRILELTGHADQPIRHVVDPTTAGSRPIRFGDIVILLRAMRFKADQYAAVLRQMSIPVHTDSSTGYFQASEVNDILSLLHVLDNQRQDIPLAAVLRSPIAGLENAEDQLAAIRLAYRGDPPVPFHLAVQKYAAEKSDDLAVSLRKFFATLHQWRQEVRQRPVAELLWSIYNQTGYLAYVAGLPNGEQRQANLIELHDRATQFGTFECQGLSRFLTFLEKLRKESDLGQASVASQAEDVVRIMTIHASKGREFPVVVIPDLGKAINLRDCQGSILLDRKAGLGLDVVDSDRQIRYPSLASIVVQQRLKQQALAEELRVLYVAMTRAREHLIMVGSCTEKQATDWSQQWLNHRGPFPTEMVLGARTSLDWIAPVASLLPNQFEVQMHLPAELTAWAAAHSTPPALTPLQTALANGQPIDPTPLMSAEARSVINKLTQHYAHQSVADLAATASVTSLVKNVGTGSSHAAPNLDRLLQRPEFLAGKLPLLAADKGTATHAVLEHFDFTRPLDSIADQIQHLIDTSRLTKELAAMVDVDAIRWFLESDIGQLIRANATQLQRELPIYYANPSNATDQTDPMDQQMIRGRIDLLIPTNGGWIIVDYKTDRVEGPALEERAALYTNQLALYRKAVQEITGKPVVESALIFLTPRSMITVF